MPSVLCKGFFFQWYQTCIDVFHRILLKLETQTFKWLIKEIRKTAMKSAWHGTRIAIGQRIAYAFLISFPPQV